MARFFSDRKYLLSYIFLFLGAAIILREYAGGRSLWVDEAMLALNMDRSFLELARPLDYNQTAPILFLFLSKLWTVLFGLSDYSLRITPLLFGLGSLYVFFLICRRVFKPAASAMCMLLFILSYRLIYYTHEFKHYSADVFFSVLFLYFFLLLKQDGFTYGKGAVIAVSVLLAVWFSFGAIVSAALLAAASLIWFIKTGSKRGIIFAAVTSVLWGLNIGAEYRFVYLGNPNFSFEPLHDYWRGGFMPFPPNGLQDLLWLPRAFKDFFVYISNTDTIFTGRFPVIIDAYAYLYTAFFFLGTVFLARHKKAYLPMYVWGAAALALGASAAGAMPFGDRLILYLVPLFLLLCAYGIYVLYKWLKKAHRSLAVIFLVVLFFLPAVPKVYHLAEPTYKVEMKPVLNYYLHNRKEEDKVYLHIDQYTYYPPQFYFYTGENFDFTNMGSEGERDPENIKKDVLGRGRVWVIGPLGKLEDYGRELDRYKVKTLASRWPFRFLREDIIHLNNPNAEIRLYDFRQYGLEEMLEGLYEQGQKSASPDEIQAAARAVIEDPDSLYGIVQDVLVLGKMDSSDEQFIKALYAGLLGREPDSSGMAHWLAELKEGKADRQEVVMKIMDSGEFKAVMQGYGAALGQD